MSTEFNNDKVMQLYTFFVKELANLNASPIDVAMTVKNILTYLLIVGIERGDEAEFLKEFFDDVLEHVNRVYASMEKDSIVNAEAKELYDILVETTNLKK